MGGVTGRGEFKQRAEDVSPAELQEGFRSEKSKVFLLSRMNAVVPEEKFNVGFTVGGEGGHLKNQQTWCLFAILPPSTSLIPRTVDAKQCHFSLNRPSGSFFCFPVLEIVHGIDSSLHLPARSCIDCGDVASLYLPCISETDTSRVNNKYRMRTEGRLKHGGSWTGSCWIHWLGPFGDRVFPCEDRPVVSAISSSSCKQ